MEVMVVEIVIAGTRASCSGWRDEGGGEGGEGGRREREKVGSEERRKERKGEKDRETRRKSVRYMVDTCNAEFQGNVL